jgi:hypothetical protein
MDEGFYCQGRWVDEAPVNWLRAWLKEHPQWSRKRLARALCQPWDWRNEGGRLKDFAARSYLLKLAGRGLIDLPALQTHQRRPRPPVSVPAAWQEPAPWESSLLALQPLLLEVVPPGTAAARNWAFYLERYHYLGLRVVGENVGYLARDRSARELACVLFGAPAWHCWARDQYLARSGAGRAVGLTRIANNSRFLILPWVRVPQLASYVLAQVGERINADWQAKYGHGLEWLETFVEAQRFAGTCYRAANWRRVGQTTGRSRQDREGTLRVALKDVYLYRLPA